MLPIRKYVGELTFMEYAPAGASVTQPGARTRRGTHGQWCGVGKLKLAEHPTTGAPATRSVPWTAARGEHSAGSGIVLEICEHSGEPKMPEHETTGALAIYAERWEPTAAFSAHLVPCTAPHSPQAVPRC